MRATAHKAEWLCENMRHMEHIWLDRQAAFWDDISFAPDVIFLHILTTWITDASTCSSVSHS